jgi:DNA-binding protein HU-beta
MAKPMTRAQIIAHLSDSLGVPRATTARLLDELVALAYREAPNSFTIPGLGKIVLVSRMARVGRNPATGEKINIPSRRALRFRVAKAAKDEILGRKGKGGYDDDRVRKVHR